LPLDVNSAVSHNDRMPSSPLALRPAVGADAPALEQLAALDSAPPLHGPALLAHHEGRLLAAVSLADGRAIADPFERTAETIELLRVRARQVAGGGSPRRGRSGRLKLPIVQPR
jgi:hypothetical protein